MFFIAMYLQELRNAQKKGKYEFIEEENIHIMMQVFIYINLLQTMVMIFVMIKMFSLTGIQFFKRVFTWFDIFFYILNTIQSLMAIQGEGLESLQHQRVLQSMAILFFLAKSFYFMKLIDEIAPLIDIIIQVFFDIKWFLFVFMCFIVSFSIALFLLGQNQREFDGLTQEENKLIPYKSIRKSLLFMWGVCLGSSGTESFNLGAGS
jgi:hypothetical protein